YGVKGEGNPYGVQILHITGVSDSSISERGRWFPPFTLLLCVRKRERRAMCFSRAEPRNEKRRQCILYTTLNKRKVYGVTE
ncbi:MAG: hypothetical protein M0P33_06510, partial [Massilibacteroides sp.]|nr:hypothetical protein [Massilibacteroides sp.]